MAASKVHVQLRVAVVLLQLFGWSLLNKTCLVLLALYLEVVSSW